MAWTKRENHSHAKRANGIGLILDAQIGRRTVPEDVLGLERYLIYEHVHLAVDPQFNVDPAESLARIPPA